MTTMTPARQLRLKIEGLAEGFDLGAGAQQQAPGFYQLGVNFDGRYGIPGPREVVDLTGIAANFRPRIYLRHADTLLCIASDGSTTRVYRKETTWVTKVDQLDGGAQNQDLTGVVTDAVSFKGILAIALGSAQAYVFTSATTATGQTWDFTTSTKTVSNAKYANYFLVQANGLLNPRVVYGRSPNEIYYTEDLTNGDATGVLPTYIGDTAAAQQQINSLTQDATGKILVGTRRYLYWVNLEDGTVQEVAGPYADGLGDAGGGSDRNNFEAPTHLAGKIYYPIEGRDLGEWDPVRLRFNPFMAPRHLNPNLPRLDLPINAMCRAGTWLVLFIGSKNTASNKSVTYAPHGNSLLANVFTTASEMWVGAYVGDTFVWHGVLLECSNPLRVAFWDEDDGYLYMGSGDAESADLQASRCLFYSDNPLNHLSGGNVVLNAGTWQVDLGEMDFGSPFDPKRAVEVFTEALGLSGTLGTAPSLAVSYKLTPAYDATAFTTLETYYVNSRALNGDRFRTGAVFRAMRLRITGVGTGNTYAIFQRLELRCEGDAEHDRTAVRR